MISYFQFLHHLHPLPSLIYLALFLFVVRHALAQCSSILIFSLIIFKPLLFPKQHKMLFIIGKKIAVDVGHILHNLKGNSKNEVCPEDKGEKEERTGDPVLGS